MSKHTAAPWAQEPEDGVHLKGPLDFFIRVYAVDPGPDNDYTICLVRDADKLTRESHARLIVAAPDLLKALKQTVASMDGLVGVFSKDSAESKFLAESPDLLLAKAAIAKAEGRNA